MSLLEVFIRPLLIALITATLMSCAALVGPSTKEKTELTLARAAQLASQGNREAAAKIYWDLAESSESPQREKFQIQAAELVLAEDTVVLSREYLSSIDETRLQGTLLVRKRLAEAELALLEGRPNAALEALSPTLDNMAPSLFTKIMMLRARALQRQGQKLASIKVRINLDHRLTQPDELELNHKAIWETLGTMRIEELSDYSMAASEVYLKGWLELAYLAHTAPPELSALNQELEAWQRRFPDHPAAVDIVPLIVEGWQALQLKVERLALILSLNRRFAAIANAIITGIMAAYYEDNANGTQPVIQVYDLGDKPQNINNLYARAVSEGADAVIGPLNKQAVAKLISMKELPIPVLTLNYGGDTRNVPSNLYQFGLLPEDEAKQVAERASGDGYQRAVVFVPRGEWGTRLLEAFGARFEALGGTVTTAEYFEPNATDYSVSIKRALLLNESEQRYRSLKKTLNLDLKFTPHRRQDVDFVFMGASPRQARLLRPQLDFHYAFDLPAYATSDIYSGTSDPAANRDINDVIYCDIPWILDHGDAVSDLRTHIEALVPDISRQFPRLIAMGIDAYHLIPHIKLLAARPHEHMPGLTGKLSMGDSNRVYRQLEWARFVNGEPTTIKDLSPSPAVDTSGW
jgi:outer membrane PBP1 activator LpoA protein